MKEKVQMQIMKRKAIIFRDGGYEQACNEKQLTFVREMMASSRW